MNASAEDTVAAYLRELSAHRKAFVFCFFVLALASLVAAYTWPKSYTSSSTIYADNSNILQPLMEGNAVTTSIVDQARMAQEIIFKRVYQDEVLKAGGYDVARLSPSQKDELVLDIQSRTTVENVGRQPAQLIRIAHTDPDPVRAFSIAQKYTSIFIEESVVEKRLESKNAFDFIQAQVTAYQTKLLESEERLSRFKSENNNGTLADANARMSRYRTEIERLELELVQLDTEAASVESELAGESAVAKGLNEMMALRTRINSLQMQLDSMRSKYHDTYPDVVQLQQQVDDLMAMYQQGQTGTLLNPEELNDNGMTPLHQELRSRLATIKTSIQSKTTQLNGIRSLLDVETERVKLINQSEAQLAELTRDYNVTQDFYNDMLKKLENARVSMHLDEEQQGVTFKVQESAVIPTQPDGLSFKHLLLGSFGLALAAPLGVLVLYMELDPRIRSESNFSPDWPPLLMAVPPMQIGRGRRISNRAFVFLAFIAAAGLYGGVAFMNVTGYI